MNFDGMPGAGAPGGFGFQPFATNGPTGAGGFPPPGFPRTIVPPAGGFPPAGFPPGGAPAAGMPVTGFPPTGFGRPPRRGKSVRRGDVRTAILILLYEQPLHGYQIMQQIEARSAGMWRPSSGSVYPTLQQLEDEGLVLVAEQDGKKVYELTRSGKDLVEQKAEEFSSLWDSVTSGADDVLMEVNAMIQQVVMAATQVTQIGSDRQVDNATRILAETRRRLYSLLAEGDTPGEEDE